MEGQFPHLNLQHYRILSKLGAGGMGEVYLAHDTRLARKVALKILPEDLAIDGERMRRFVQKAKAASALNHPNIITIYEVGEAGKKHFISANSDARSSLIRIMRSVVPSSRGISPRWAGLKKASPRTSARWIPTRSRPQSMQTSGGLLFGASLRRRNRTTSKST